MHIQDIFEACPTTFSFEFFPPKTDKASDELFETIAQLQTLKPSFVSVTYGAGGSTRERTHDLIVRIQRETKLTAVSHLTCVCHTEDEIAAILDRYAQSSIENILALGGDPPRTMANYDRSRDAFQYAEQLVRFIRSHAAVARPDGDSASGSRGFPKDIPRPPTASRSWTISSARWMPAPTTFAPSSFSATPISTISASGASWPASGCRSSPGSCRSPPRKTWRGWPSWPWARGFPARLLRAIDRCDDDPKAVAKVGVHWATEQCRDLLDNQVRGIHFYTLNRSDATRKIYENLGLTRD